MLFPTKMRRASASGALICKDSSAVSRSATAPMEAVTAFAAPAAETMSAELRPAAKEQASLSLAERARRPCLADRPHGQF